MNTTPKVTKVTSKEKTATDIKLIVPHDVHQKILYWMTKSKNEVSGYGSLTYEESTNTFTVKDVILLKQTVTAASTELDAHAIGKAMYAFRDEPLGLKWHWHTHPKMGVFWSNDDMEVIRSHGQQGWIIASVFNEKGEVKTAYHTTTKINVGGSIQEHDLFADDIATSIISFYPQSFFDELDKEFVTNVTEDRTYSYIPDYTADTGLPFPQFAGQLRQMRENFFKGDDVDFPDLVFSDYGYAQTPGNQWVYNPLYDKDLKSELERIEMIDEMEQWEIDFLNWRDPEFKEFYRSYEASQILVEAKND